MGGRPRQLSSPEILLDAVLADHLMRRMHAELQGMGVR